MNTVSIIDKIWKQLDGIRYAIWDDKTQTPIYMDTDIVDERENPEYMNRYCRVLTPEEVLKYKIGTCWDVTICICYLAELNNLPFQTYYFETTKQRTHIVASLFYKNFWYMIEHSRGDLYGIHKFKNLEMCWDLQDSTLKDESIIYRNYNFSDKINNLFYDYNISIQKFLKITGTVLE